MKKALHLRLSVFLLDSAHTIRACDQVEGQPRYAIRSAMEKALKLAAYFTHDVQLRIVIIPSGQGTMPQLCQRAAAMSKAGQVVMGLDPWEIRQVGRRAALMAWFGMLAESIRADRAKAIQGVRLAA